MTITHGEITTAIGNYLDRYPGEAPHLEQVLHAIKVGADITSRTEFNGGHITCGAVVIDETRKLLLIRHKALAAWLLPGGHLEPDDSGLPLATLRELEEETGIAWQQTVAPYGYATPIDIDVHAIPANPAKEEPVHWHADFRYAFYVTHPGVHPQFEEVDGYAWRSLTDAPTTKLAAKIASL